MRIQLVEFADMSIPKWQDFLQSDSRVWSSIEVDRCGGHVDVFLNSILSKVRRLELRRCLRTDAAFYSLGIGLKFNKTLIGLDLGRTPFTISQAKAFADGLCFTRVLRTLTLKQCTFDQPQAVTALGIGLQENKSLYALSIIGCLFPESGLEELLSHVAKHPHLQVLHATPDQHGSIGIHAISNWLDQEQSKAKVLVLRRRFVNPSKSDNLLRKNPEFVQALIRNRTLQKLGFGCNIISSEDMQCLRLILEKNTTLQSIKLDSNTIDDLSPLTYVLSHDNNTLVDLDLANNRLDETTFFWYPFLDCWYSKIIIIRLP